MTKLIKDGAVITDEWHLYQPGEVTETQMTGGHAILPLGDWLANRETLLASDAPLGVWLDSHDTPESIADDIGRLTVIAINFPVFGDGRGYSIARLLRERYGYRGEIRAIGDVMQDQLFYLQRSGFNAFALKAGRDIESALKALNDFSETYQAGADNPLPLFRRRA